MKKKLSKVFGLLVPRLSGIKWNLFGKMLDEILAQIDHFTRSQAPGLDDSLAKS